MTLEDLLLQYPTLVYAEHRATRRDLQRPKHQIYGFDGNGCRSLWSGEFDTESEAILDVARQLDERKQPEQP